jgi:hypothetical protein
MRKYNISFSILLFVIIAAISGVMLFSGNKSQNTKINSCKDRKGRMKDIMHGISIFKETGNHLLSVTRDKSGRPLCSWRYEVQAWIDIGGPYKIENAWYDPINAKIAESPSSLYCYTTEKESMSRLNTNIMAITGPGTAFDGQIYRGHELPNSLILFVEVADLGIHWMEPGDLDVRELPASLTSGLDGEGLFVAFADNEIWYLRKDVPLEVLTKFLTVEEAQSQDREKLLGPYHIANN